MALRDVRWPWKVGMVFFSIGLIKFLIGFTTLHWYQFNNVFQESYFGLFRVCGSVSEQTVCEYLTSSDVPMTDWMKAGLGLACLGMILYVTAWAVAFMAMRQSKKSLMLVGGGAGVAAGVLGIIASIVVLVKAKEDFDVPQVHFSIGWSAIVFLIGCVWAIVGGVLHVFGAFIGQADGSEHSPLLKN